ncbi:MAG TPA: hypothetical protein VNZ58_01805, partial [Thermomicrobiales bacterium]|nr:hypothetical protein [Thermomicrobiales bacterium]
MPDLPADLFDDEDEDLYDRRPSRSPRRERNVDDWEDARPEPRERTKRTRRKEDEFQDERPKRKREQHPQRRDVDDVYEVVAVREERRRSVDSFTEDRAIQAPPPIRRRVDRSRTPQRPVGPSRHDRVIEQPRMQAEAAALDMVTSIAPSPQARPVRRSRHRNPAWSWKPIVMPQPRQIAQQMFPNMLMALTALAILYFSPYIPLGLPLWAPLLMAPMLILAYVSDRDVHPMWSRAGLVNLVTVGV